MNTINPLKEELSSTITSCRKLEKRVGECQRDVELEKETQRVLERQHVIKVCDFKQAKCANAPVYVCLSIIN